MAGILGRLCGPGVPGLRDVGRNLGTTFTYTASATLVTVSPSRPARSRRSSQLSIQSFESDLSSVERLEELVTEPHSLGQGGIDDGGPLNLYLKKCSLRKVQLKEDNIEGERGRG